MKVIPHIFENGWAYLRILFLFQLFKGRFFAFATQTQMAKFEQCISYAGGQAGVFAHASSKFRDPSIFQITNNLLIQPEQPIKSKSGIWLIFQDYFH